MDPARIGLDITLLAKSRTGVENNIAALAEHLPAADAGLKFIYFSAWPQSARFPAPVVAGTTFGSYFVWRETVLPGLLRAHRVDLFHAPLKAVPVRWGGPVVNTIQDVIWLRHPEAYPMVRRLTHWLWCQVSVRKVRRVIVPSAATARDLAELMPSIASAKMVTIPLSAPAWLTCDGPIAEADALLRKLEVQPPFLLAVGTIQPRKNYERLIEAVSRLEALGAPRHRLVIVGKDGYDARRIRAVARAGPRGEDVRLTGYLDDADTALLYRAAAAFVYPSLYEGFGLPVLEAMALGTPVICSNTSSLPEVGGEAACYFNPTDVDDMASAIAGVITNPARKTELARRGFERVALFTAQRMASRTAVLYRELLNETASSDHRA